MTAAEFSRAAARVLNAPYWVEDYAGTDVTECVRWNQTRQREKDALTRACSKIESAGGTFTDVPPDALVLWRKASATLGAKGGSG